MVRRISDAIVTAGIIITVVGIYYLMVKAGIPYQDPPLELEIQYAANTAAGNALVKTGIMSFVTGIAAKVIAAVSIQFAKQRKK